MGTNANTQSPEGWFLQTGKPRVERPAEKPAKNDCGKKFYYALRWRVSGLRAATWRSAAESEKIRGLTGVD